MTAILVFVICTFLLVSSNGQDCTINEEEEDTLVIGSVKETQTPDFLFWTGDADFPLKSASLDNSTKYVSLHHSPNNIFFAVTADFKTYIDAERKNPLIVVITIVCQNEQSNRYNVHIPIIDENTNGPTFSRTSVTYRRNSEAEASVPLNGYNMEITDRDFDPSNAQVICLPNDYINVRLVPITNSSAVPYRWNYWLHLNEDECGRTNSTDFTTTVYCTDGVHIDDLVVNVKFDFISPVFSERVYRSSISGRSVPAGYKLSLDNMIWAEDPDDPSFYYLIHSFTPNILKYDEYNTNLAFRDAFVWNQTMTLVVEDQARDASGRTTIAPIVIEFKYL